MTGRLSAAAVAASAAELLHSYVRPLHVRIYGYRQPGTIYDRGAIVYEIRILMQVRTARISMWQRKQQQVPYGNTCLLYMQL